MEVFDKRAVSKGEVIFHAAYVEFKPHLRGENFQLNYLILLFFIMRKILI